jgi:hypothetical protein
MPGFKPKGGGGHGKLSGGHWATIGHHHVYVKGGKVVAGGIPGVTHDRHGSMLGPARHGADSPHGSIPMHPKKGGHADTNAAWDHKRGPDHEKARDEARSQREYRKAGEDHAKAKAAHAKARADLQSHDDRTAKGKAALDSAAHAERQRAADKVAGLRAKLAAHNAKAGKPAAAGKAAPKPASRDMTAAEYANHHGISESAASNHLRDAYQKGHVKAGSRGGSYSVPHNAPAPHGAKATKAGKPNSGGESHTAESYAKKHGIGGANAFAHLDSLHAAGKVAQDRHTGEYHVPAGAPTPKGSKAGSPTHRPVTHKASPPRTAQEAAIHADARARGKSAAVVTSTPQYHAEKHGGTTHHGVGGRTIASHHVDANGKHVVIVHNDDGSHSVYRHRTKEGAKFHVQTLAKAAIAKGTKRYAVVGNDLSKFDHRAFGIGGEHHKVTGRVLGGKK